jgi:hypothetical protein
MFTMADAIKNRKTFCLRGDFFGAQYQSGVRSMLPVAMLFVMQTEKNEVKILQNAVTGAEHLQ